MAAFSTRTGLFVKSPGCYAWQVDGLGFSEIIVVRAVLDQNPPSRKERCSQAVTAGSQAGSHPDGRLARTSDQDERPARMHPRSRTHLNRLG